MEMPQPLRDGERVEPTDSKQRSDVTRPLVSLRRLYLLVHPFYKLDGRLDDDDHPTRLALNFRYRLLAAGLQPDEALVALPAASDVQKPDLSRLLADVQAQLREQFLTIVDDDMGIVRGVREGTPTLMAIRDGLRAQGMALGPETTLVACGETAPHCVPRVVDHARQVLTPDRQAEILLSATDWGHDLTQAGNTAALRSLGEEIARDHPGVIAVIDTAVRLPPQNSGVG
jgi:hypothetical protein